jgi:KUP system potassium uptake protein
LRFGFQDDQDDQDDQDVPAALRIAQSLGQDVDPDTAYNFLSKITVQRGSGTDGMSTWRKRLFIGLNHNSADPAVYFCLPEDRTVVMGAQLAL